MSVGCCIIGIVDFWILDFLICIFEISIFAFWDSWISSKEQGEMGTQERTTPVFSIAKGAQ